LKGTMSVSIDVSLLVQFDALVEKYQTTRSERVNEWIRLWVERETVMPELKVCPKHNCRYSPSLPVCPECAIEGDLVAKAKAEADKVLGATAEAAALAEKGKALKQEYNNWCVEQSKKSSHPKYIVHSELPTFEQYKAGVREKPKVEE